MPDSILAGEKLSSSEKKQQDSTGDDLDNSPSLSLPDRAYPKTQSKLEDLGLWNNPIQMHRSRRELWAGQTEGGATIGYGTCLSILASKRNQIELPLTLPMSSGEALVIHHECTNIPKIQKLIDLLKQRIQTLTKLPPKIRSL